MGKQNDDKVSKYIFGISIQFLVIYQLTYTLKLYSKDPRKAQTEVMDKPLTVELICYTKHLKGSFKVNLKKRVVIFNL